MNMKIKKLNIKDIYYFIKINIFIFLAVLITFPQSYSKPIPPGSGEGDVPANILFLLDSSLSMKNPVTGGTYLGLSGVDWAVELSDGNLIVGEKGDGAVKILTAESKKDTSFANGNINFTGKAKDSTCDNSPTGKKALKNFSSEAKTTASGAVSSADIVWFGSQATENIVGINSDGTCKAVFKTDVGMYKTLEIRRIGGEDILFAFGRAYMDPPAPVSKRQQLGYLYVKNLGASGSDLNGAEDHCDLHRAFGDPGKDNSGNLFNTTKKICHWT